MTKLETWLEQTKFINDNGKGQLGQAVMVIEKLKSALEFYDNSEDSRNKIRYEIDVLGEPRPFGWSARNALSTDPEKL